MLLLGVPRRWLSPPYPVFAMQKLAGRAFRGYAIAPLLHFVPQRLRRPSNPSRMWAHMEVR